MRRLTVSDQPNGYDLSRLWFNFAFDNPEKISPNHAAIYFFAIEHRNRLGGKEKFGFPTMMACDAIGIKKASTYIKYLNDLVDWGFIIMIEKSTNQYSANIICLTNALPKKGQARDKATMNHRDKQGDKQTVSKGISKVPIDKSLNHLTTNSLNHSITKTNGGFTPPDLNEAKDYFYLRVHQDNPLIEKRECDLEAEKFMDHYKSNGWMVGRSKMKDWKATTRNWIRNIKQFAPAQENQRGNTYDPRDIEARFGN